MTACISKVRLNEPLRGIRLVTQEDVASAAEWEKRLRARYEEGVKEGQKSVREQLVQQRAEILALQNGVLDSWRKILPQVRAECEEALVELALEVARKLVGDLPITADMVAGAVKEALESVEDGHEITVLLQPQDMELLQSVNAPVLLATVGGEKIRFQSSTEVTRGGCLVQTRFGMLDARRETKFEKLCKVLQS